MTIRYLIEKEFLQIRRNPFLPKLIVVFPIVMMCVIPWVMNQEVKNIRVDVVDNDRSTRSRQLMQSIDASNYFIMNGQKASYQAALSDIERSKADIALVIPQDYGRDIELAATGNPTAAKGSGVLSAANAVNGTKGSMTIVNRKDLTVFGIYALEGINEIYPRPSKSSVNTIVQPVSNKEVIHTLQGIRLNQMPMTKGIYIINGKKIIK